MEWGITAGRQGGKQKRELIRAVCSKVIDLIDVHQITGLYGHLEQNTHNAKCWQYSYPRKNLQRIVSMLIDLYVFAIDMSSKERGIWRELFVEHSPNQQGMGLPRLSTDHSYSTSLHPWPS